MATEKSDASTHSVCAERSLAEAKYPLGFLSLLVGRPIFERMNLKDGATVVAELTTIGRKSGLSRPVELRFQYYQGCFYASSSRVQGKHWCQNMIKNPSVKLRVSGEKLACTAVQITDSALRKKILTLRESPPHLNRVVFEIRPVG